MRQILTNLRNGAIELAEVPTPVVEPGQLLIRTRASLVSPGTEKMLVQFGSASLLQKARQNPERVRQVLQKIRADGLMPTLEAVFRRLDEPMPLGYCNCGEVIAVGAGVQGYAVGDRVVSNGPHAEIVAVPASLAAKVPSAVEDNAAAFTVLAAVALQGIRLAEPTLGETVAVMGLGLVGQLTVQLLKAAGCVVLGYDVDPAKVALARQFGADAQVLTPEVDPVRHAVQATAGNGVDAVIVAASARSNEVMSQSAQMARKRGRIVLVGVVGLELNRAEFYEKELTFQVSCSYGPGRYELAYEEKGYDYPPGFVRWTAQRNFEAVLGQMASGALAMAPLITRTAPLERWSEIYHNLGSGLGFILQYPAQVRAERTVVLNPERAIGGSSGALALIGAGTFGRNTAMPALAAAGAAVKYIVSASGLSAAELARKYRVPQASSDLGAVLADAEVKGVIISTQHHQHAAMTISALAAGKQVLVEKPLCLTATELGQIEKARSSSSGTVSVGFNRRFAPLVVKMKQMLGEQPARVVFMAQMNAGVVPRKSWIHDVELGGGRILGEACHLIDLAVFVTGDVIESVCAAALPAEPGQAAETVSIVLRHRHGSLSTLTYFANGHRSYGKERFEAHHDGRSLVLENFRQLTGHGFRSFTQASGRQDKGHARQFATFAERVRLGGAPLIPWAETANVMQASLAVLASLKDGGWVRVSEIGASVG